MNSKAARKMLLQNKPCESSNALDVKLLAASMVPSAFSWTYEQASNNKKELITMFNPSGLASSKIGRKITLSCFKIANREVSGSELDWTGQCTAG